MGRGVPKLSLPFGSLFHHQGVGNGTGLGLDIARRCCETARGNIRFFSEPGNTRFRVRLPINGHSSP